MALVSLHKLLMLPSGPLANSPLIVVDQTPRSAAVFLIDCNASMNSLHQFEDDIEEDGSVRQRSSLDVAKEYVKAKVVQRVGLSLLRYLLKWD